MDCLVEDLWERVVRPGRAFVIAEAGVNHNGDMDLARSLVDAAAESGADAVKFQSFKACRLATPGAPKAQYQNKTTDPEESQLDMLKRLELSESDHMEIMQQCRRRSILFLSTPFDENSADLLERLDVPLFKIPSGEITNLPFLEHVALKQRPMILSTGMSSLREVEKAVRVVKEAGNHRLALLHCVSRYPAAHEESNLRAMKTMERAFGLPLGFSDHTSGIQVSIAAVALGAKIIEKHFTLDRTLAGPDHRASLTPDELVELVRSIRIVESAMGDGRKIPVTKEAETAAVARKSLVAVKDIPSGTTLIREMLEARRPGTGISPEKMADILGRTSSVFIGKDTLLNWDMIQ